MSRRRLIGMAWYHWVFIIFVIGNTIVNNPGQGSGYYLGTTIGSILVIRFLVAIWSAFGEFWRGYKGEEA